MVIKPWIYKVKQLSIKTELFLEKYRQRPSSTVLLVFGAKTKPWPEDLYTYSIFKIRDTDTFSTQPQHFSHVYRNTQFVLVNNEWLGGGLEWAQWTIWHSEEALSLMLQRPVILAVWCHYWHSPPTLGSTLPLSYAGVFSWEFSWHSW